MKNLLTILLLSTISFGTVSAQKQPAGMRVEVAEAESDRGEYSIFTYKDTDDIESFGYYLGLGRVTDYLGADEILGIELKNIREVTIWLGATTEEALSTIGFLLDLYGEDVETTAEFQGRAATGGFQLGEPVTTACVVRKNLIGGKRLEFFFPCGRGQAHAYLPKSVLKGLRTNLKIDIKMHPKQHRKQ